MAAPASTAANPEEDDLWNVVDSLGRSTANLLFRTGWMVRRKDAVELLSDTWARHQTTVHLGIPAALEPLSNDGPPHYAVPITLLPKVPPTLMQFDFNCGGERLTMPTRRQNGLASYAALLWAAHSAIGEWPLHPDLRRQLLFVAVGPPEYAAPVSWMMRAPRGGPPQAPDLEVVPPLSDAEAALIDWCFQMRGEPTPDHEPPPDHRSPLTSVELSALHDKLSRHSLAEWCLRKLATSSVVLAVIPRAPSGTQTVSLSYDLNLFKPKQPDVGKGVVARNGWIAYPVIFQTPYVGARSYHFEFIAPPGIEVIHSRLVEIPPDEDEWGLSEATSRPEQVHGPEPDDDDELGRPEYDYVPIRGERIHLYRAEDTIADAIGAQLFLRASREGFISSARLAAYAVAATLIACAVLTRPLVSHASGAQSLLLLFPGLLVTVTARAGGHALIIRMLQGARRTLLFSGVLAFAGAALLSFIHTGKGAHAAEWHRWVYIALATFAVWQAGKLGLARKLPRRPEPQGWLEQRIEGIRLRAERRANRQARWRQRSLLLKVTATKLSADAARRIAAASVAEANNEDASSTERPLPLVAHIPHYRRSRPASLRIPTSIGSGRHQRPLLIPAAQPSDRHAMQELDLARRMAATIRWLDEQLPGGYRLQIRWSPLGRQIRRSIRHVGRSIWRPSGQGPARRWGPTERTERPAAEVAAAARRGDLRMNSVHCIGPQHTSPRQAQGAPPAAPPTERSAT